MLTKSELQSIKGVLRFMKGKKRDINLVIELGLLTADWQRDKKVHLLIAIAIASDPKAEIWQQLDLY